MLARIPENPGDTLNQAQSAVCSSMKMLASEDTVSNAERDEAVIAANVDADSDNDVSVIVERGVVAVPNRRAYGHGHSPGALKNCL